ncbi:hypothetical protein [Phascolarctobacterium sp.]
MFKIITTTFFLLFFSLSCYAEITYFSNEFTNQKYAISVNQRNKSDNFYKIPNTIAFRKELNSTNDNFKLFLMCSMSQNPSSLDKTNFKFDNIKIISITPNVDYNNSAPNPAAYDLDKEFVASLFHANSLQIQIPLFTHDKAQIKYLEYTIPNSILDEWKQVIAME